MLLSALAMVLMPPIAAASTARATTLLTPSLIAVGKVPLYFEANDGQADALVKFMARGLDHTTGGGDLVMHMSVGTLRQQGPVGLR